MACVGGVFTPRWCVGTTDPHDTGVLRDVPTNHMHPVGFLPRSTPEFSLHGPECGNVGRVLPPTPCARAPPSRDLRQRDCRPSTPSNSRSEEVWNELQPMLDVVPVRTTTASTGFLIHQPSACCLLTNTLIVTRRRDEQRATPKDRPWPTCSTWPFERWCRTH